MTQEGRTMCRSPQYSREEEEPGDKLGCPEFTEGLLHQAEFSPLNFTGFRKTLRSFGKKVVGPSPERFYPGSVRWGNR